MAYGKNITAITSKGVGYDPDTFFETPKGNISPKGKLITKDTAKSMQAASVVSRKANDKVKALIKEFVSQSVDAPPALDVMKAIMISQLADEDNIEALKTANMIAEFETPKLSRREVEQRNIEVTEMSVEDIEGELNNVNLKLVGNSGDL